jgi:AraC-like DNA-binding protein
MVRVLVEAVELAGTPRQEFIEAAGLSNDPRLTDSSRRFEFEEYERLQRLAIELTGDPALSLHMADRVAPAAFDMVGQLVVHASTLRDAIGQCQRFGALMQSEGRVALHEGSLTAKLQLESPRAFPLLARANAELAMTGFLKVMRAFIGPRAAARAVYFEHAAPDYHREYTRIFAGAERFDQPMTAIEFDREWLDTKQLHQHARLASILESEAQRALAQLTRGRGVVDELARYLATRPAACMPSMDAAAKDLGMSVRSLRRKLSAEGASYRSVVQATLENFVTRVLQNPERSLKEVALAAGFSDFSTFHRAFKRWTGLSPSEFRRTRINETETP